MRSATSIHPSLEEAYFHQFDLRDLDAQDQHSFWRLQYLRRIEAVLDVVRANTPLAGSVLEIGSAQANMSLMLAEQGFAATAADLSQAALSYSRKKYERGRLEWRHGNAFEMQFEALFHAVILAELVEHVAEPAQLIRLAWDLVLPGGVLVITTPNGGCLTNRLPTYSAAVQEMDRLREFQFGPGGEHHLFALTMDELQSMIPDHAQVVERRWLCSLAINRRTQPLLHLGAARPLIRLAARTTEAMPGVRQLATTSLLLALRKH